MLNNLDGTHCIPEEAVIVDCAWHWVDSMTTLLSEEFTSTHMSLRNERTAGWVWAAA